MGWIYAILLGVAVAVLVAAEWPRLAPRFGLEGRTFQRPRRKKRRHLYAVPPSSESEEFAASVERDLDRLPTIDER